MNHAGLNPTGTWIPRTTHPAFASADLVRAIHRIREPVSILQDRNTGYIGLGIDGKVQSFESGEGSNLLNLGTLPAMYPEWLGDRSFAEAHGVKFPYVAGAMYQGIASADMVLAMANAGMLGFFGAAGMQLDTLEKNLAYIRRSLGDSGMSWGSNLIYMPAEQELESNIVDLYFRYGVRRVSAAAFMTLSPNIVRYATKGLKIDAAGNVYRHNHVFAKLSRPEIAELFMAPAPKQILDLLVKTGKITENEAAIAARVPIAEDITVEADSGGHTDNRPLSALLPPFLRMREEMMGQYNYNRQIRIGAAGGLGTPSSVAAAFAMGAAYVLTGSVNQSAVESGMSKEGRALLAKADVSDVTMAPAADMFEMGVKVQVLQRGTMFSNRAAQLYSIYLENDSIDTIPSETRARLERDVFSAPLEKIWEDTRSYFSEKNPAEIEKAKKNPKHLMALVFRWYLGNSAFWAIKGDTSHLVDFQICCGPSMGAFNNWVRGSYLEQPENRNVVGIALNLIEGAAVVTRAQQARSYGVPVPGAAFDFRPRRLN